MFKKWSMSKKEEQEEDEKEQRQFGGEGGMLNCHKQ
jgi:hypothetical protein